MVDFGRGPLRFFAHADEDFDQHEAERHTCGEIERSDATKLHPGEGCAVDTDPDGLASDDAGGREVLDVETAVDKVDDGQRGAGEREGGAKKERPARTERGQRKVDEGVQTTPSKDEHGQRGGEVGAEGWFHGLGDKGCKRNKGYKGGNGDRGFRCDDYTAGAAVRFIGLCMCSTVGLPPCRDGFARCARTGINPLCYFYEVLSDYFRASIILSAVTF